MSSLTREAIAKRREHYVKVRDEYARAGVAEVVSDYDEQIALCDMALRALPAGEGAKRELKWGCTCKDAEGRAQCWSTNGAPDCELPPAPVAAEANGVFVPQDVWDWLMGEGPNFEPTAEQREGVFGPGKYWWRSQLRAKIEAAQRGANESNVDSHSSKEEK